MRISVIGAGYVGLTAACCLANSGHQVTCIENDEAKLHLLQQGLSPIKEQGIDKLLKDGTVSGNLKFASTLVEPIQADIVIVAVGTPSLPNGSADLSYIHQAVAQVKNAAKRPFILVMKSTVPPGTGIKLIERYLYDTSITYVSNPEFLREGQAIWDWHHPSRIVIGANDSGKAEKVLELYGNADAPVLVTDITSAEMVKYAANAFLVTKISFINEIANLCEAIGAHIDDVAEGMGFDPRIGHDFLRAGFGYGGSCFPKDARALDFSALSNGYDLRLLKATIEVNTKQRIAAVQKLKHFLGSLTGKEVALLGLSFKPGTDDLREAPALDIAQLLGEEGAKLRVYDPMVGEGARPFLPADTLFANDVYSAADGANAVVLVTDWPEIVQADWATIKQAMKEPCLVLDGRNALNSNSLTALGFKYVGVGRRTS
ncbi:MAG: UDP-glucose dehydrogenase family protein [Chloroflexota bacterium]